MLPASFRIKKKDFDLLKSLKKKVFFGENLFLKIYKSDEDISRFSFIVSKNNFKKAVDRNKIKRRVRNILMEFIKKDEIKKGNLVVIFLNKDFKKEITFQELKNEIYFLFNKTGILK